MSNGGLKGTEQSKKYYLVLRKVLGKDKLKNEPESCFLASPGDIYYKTLGTQTEIEASGTPLASFTSADNPDRSLRCIPPILAPLVEQEYELLVAIASSDERRKILDEPLFQKIMMLQGGDVVEFNTNNGPQIGKLCYIGPIKRTLGTYFGITLEDAFGDCDGTSDGISYFKAKKNHGMFITANQIVDIEKDEKVQQLSRDKSNLEKNVEEHFTCPICLEMVDNVVDCNACHKVFCESCCDGIKECPLCRTNPFEFSASHVTRQLIGNLETNCPNQGCDEKPTRSNLPDHQKKCPFAIVECPNEDCIEQVPRKMLPYHAEKCLFLMMSCDHQGCFALFNRADALLHKILCEYGTIRCSNEGCNAKFLRKELESHIREDCR